jgi:hypothetical protein
VFVTEGGQFYSYVYDVQSLWGGPSPNPYISCLPLTAVAGSLHSELSNLHPDQLVHRIDLPTRLKDHDALREAHARLQQVFRLDLLEDHREVLGATYQQGFANGSVREREAWLGWLHSDAVSDTAADMSVDAWNRLLISVPDRAKP